MAASKLTRVAATIAVVALSLLGVGCSSAGQAHSAGSVSVSPTWKPSNATGDIEATVVVRPARQPGVQGALCGGTGKYADIQYGYKVNFTAIYGTVHYAFLGDGLTGVDVEPEHGTDACLFGLILPPSHDGPFKITIGGHEFDISVQEAQRAVVLTMP